MTTHKQPEAHNNGGIKEGSTFTKPRWPSSRRTLSLCSSSSSSSNSLSSFKSPVHGFSPPPSPEGGIPFSWESIPGIPKTHIILKKIDSSRKSNHLPLPPAASTVSSSQNINLTQRRNHISATRKDPFSTALIECSKSSAGEHKVVFERFKSSKSLSLRDRVGFSNMSCKNSPAIAESIVFLSKVKNGPR